MKAYRFIIPPLIACYGILWIGGVISYLFLGGPSSEALWTAPLFLFLAGGLVMTFSDLTSRLPLVAVGLLGLGVEIVGVRLGVPFGRYVYTDVLQPSILGVPCAIGCAWLVLFAYVKQMLQLGGIRTPWLQLWGAAWMFTLDLLIDPLASGPLSYWIWQEKGWYFGIPLVNFAGWFGVSLALFLIFRAPWPKRIGVAWVGLSVVIFFWIIAIAYEVNEAFLTGLLLCLLHGWIFWLGRNRIKRP